MKLKEMIQQSKLLIFDLDGTLYEDTEHFDYYCKLLQKKVDPEIADEFYETYEKMKEGIHPVKIGKVYDLQNDAAITIEPLTMQITAVHNWDGSEWTREKREKEYGETISFDLKRMIAIGDGWWLPFVTAVHYGLTEQDTWEAYNLTKEYMVSDQFSLTKTPGLKEALTRLKEEKIIAVLTNSEHEDVMRLLRELGLEGLFHEVVTSALKPVKTKERFTYLLEKYKVKPEEAVSIGDNILNEIAPALLSGMKAIYIQPNGFETEHENLTVVPTLANAF